MLLKLKKAQGATEYAIFIAAVLIALIAIQVYFQRSVKGKFKSSSDQVGEQFTTEANNTYQTISVSARRSISGDHRGVGVDGVEQNVTSSSVVLDQSENAAFNTALSGFTGADVRGSVLGADNYAGGAYSTSDYVIVGGDAGVSDTARGEVGDHSVYDGDDFRSGRVFDEGS